MRLIDSVASADNLTLVVGAGVSMDAGLPSWKDLVRTFLEEGFRDAEAANLIDDTRTYDARAASILASQDVLSAATIGRHLHGEKRDAQIMQALYRGQPARPRAGRITTAIAALALIRRQNLRILTTNYDDLIERSIEDAGGAVTVKTISETGIETVADGGSNATEIVHLHGYAPYNDRVYGLLILDDEDYATTPVRPPGDVLPDLMTAGPTVFVGLSMSDPNLVAACYLVARHFAKPNDLPWFGLFVGEADIPDDTAWFLRKRLEGMGIHPLGLVSFGQISQIFHEVIRRIGEEQEYWSDATKSRYGRRLGQWRANLDARYPCATGGDGFADEQRRLHDALAELVTELRHGLLSAVDQDEHLAFNLWVRKPGTQLGTLELWGSSAHLHREPWSLDLGLEIKAGTGYQVIDCVYYAAIQKRNSAPKGIQTRWQAMISIPIDLSTYKYGDLVVGAISIASTYISTKSVLRDVKPELIDRLQTFGRDWLTPPL